MKTKLCVKFGIELFQDTAWFHKVVKRVDIIIVFVDRIQIILQVNTIIFTCYLHFQENIKTYVKTICLLVLWM